MPSRRDLDWSNTGSVHGLIERLQKRHNCVADLFRNLSSTFTWFYIFWVSSFYSCVWGRNPIVAIHMKATEQYFHMTHLLTLATFWSDQGSRPLLLTLHFYSRFNISLEARTTFCHTVIFTPILEYSISYPQLRYSACNSYSDSFIFFYWQSILLPSDSRFGFPFCSAIQC